MTHRARIILLDPDLVIPETGDVEVVIHPYGVRGCREWMMIDPAVERKREPVEDGKDTLAE